LPKTFSAFLIALLYGVILLGFQAEMVPVVRQVLAVVQVDSHPESALSTLQKTAIHAHSKRCIHHTVACPPDCHCPALVENAETHVDGQEVEGEWLAGDAVWRPCASHADGLLAWDLPWQLPTEVASLLNPAAPVQWHRAGRMAILESLPREIDKVPIL
jgi:hypothetical protein